MELRSVLYSVPYAIVFLILLFLYFRERESLKKVNLQAGENSEVKAVRMTALILLLLFIGLRGFIYTDCIEYYRLFEEIPSIGRLHIDDYNMESGFIIYTSLFKTIIPNYYCWVFFNTLFDLLVFYSFFKNNTNSVALAFLVFLAYQGLYIEFNLYRNAKAISFFILSLPYLKDRKFLPYLLLNLLGASFHVGAFLLIPFYFFIHKKWPKPVLWALFIIANICFFLDFHPTSILLDKFAAGASDYLAFKASKYAKNTETYGLSFGYVEKTMITCLIVFLYNKLANKNSSNIIYSNSAVVFYFITFLFSDIAILTERLSYMFIFSLWVVLTEIFYIKFNSKRIVTIGLLLLLFMRLIESNMTAMCYYDNLLWGIMDLDQRTMIIERFN